MVSKKITSYFKKIALVGAVATTVPFVKSTMAHASHVHSSQANTQLTNKNADINNSNNTSSNYTLPSDKDINNALIRYQNRILTQRSQDLANVVSRKAALNKSTFNSQTNAVSPSSGAASANAQSVSMSTSSQPSSLINTHQASGRAERHLEHLAEYYTDVFINMYDQSNYKDLSHFVLGLADQANRNHLSHKIDINFSPDSSTASSTQSRSTDYIPMDRSASTASFNRHGLSHASVSAENNSTVNTHSVNTKASGNTSTAYNATVHADGRTAGQKEFNRIVSKAATGLSHIASHFNAHDANHQIFRHMFSLAKTKLGDPYVWGGTGSHTFDCSGFTQYLYWHAAHHFIPRTAGAQYDDTKRIPESEAHLGDLVFFGGSPYNIEHVGLYLGHGMMIDAQLRGVIIEHVHAPWWDLVGFGRVRL